MNTEDIRERFITPQSVAEAMDPDAHYIMGEEFDKWLSEIKSEVRKETLLEVEKAIEDPVTSPVWCWELCGDPKCPDDIAVHTAMDIQKMITTIRLTKGDTK